MGKTVFVKIDDFKDITEIMSLAHTRLGQARQTLAKINALKQQEDAMLDNWVHELDDISSKIDSVDKQLLGKEED